MIYQRQWLWSCNHGKHGVVCRLPSGVCTEPDGAFTASGGLYSLLSPVTMITGKRTGLSAKGPAVLGPVRTARDSPLHRLSSVALRAIECAGFDCARGLWARRGADPDRGLAFATHLRGEAFGLDSRDRLGRRPGPKILSLSAQWCRVRLGCSAASKG